MAANKLILSTATACRHACTVVGTVRRRTRRPFRESRQRFMPGEKINQNTRNKRKIGLLQLANCYDSASSYSTTSSVYDYEQGVARKEITTRQRAKRSVKSAPPSSQVNTSPAVNRLCNGTKNIYQEQYAIAQHVERRPVQPTLRTKSAPHVETCKTVTPTEQIFGA